MLFPLIVFGTTIALHSSMTTLTFDSISANPNQANLVKAAELVALAKKAK